MESICLFFSMSIAIYLSNHRYIFISIYTYLFLTISIFTYLYIHTYLYTNLAPRCLLAYLASLLGILFTFGETENNYLMSICVPLRGCFCPLFTCLLSPWFCKKQPGQQEESCLSWLPLLLCLTEAPVGRPDIPLHTCSQSSITPLPV